MTVSVDLDARVERPEARGIASLARSPTERKGRATYLLYIAANIAPRVAMFALFMVFTRVLPVQEFGLFALVVTMGEILDMTAANWVRVYILRTDAGLKTLTRRRLGRALSLSWGATLFSLAAAAIAVPLVSDIRDADLVIATLVYIVAFSLVRLTLTFAQLTQRHAAYAVIEWTRAVGIAAATAVVPLVGITSFLPASLILSFVTAAICGASLVYTLRGLPWPHIPRSGYLSALEFGLPFMLAALLSYTLGWFDRFIVNYFAGPASVAIYVAAFALARQPVELLVGPLNNYIFPILARAYNNGRSAEAAAIQAGVLTSIIAISAATVCGLSLLATPLATLFFPANYRESVATLIPLIAAGTLFLTLKQFVFDNSFHITKRTWLLLASMLPSAIVSIVLGIALIRSYGNLGAAVTYVIATFLALSVSAWASLSIFRFPIHWSRLLGIAAAAAAASAVTWPILPLAAKFGMLSEIAAGVVAFSATYAGVLMLCGISIRHLVELPWVPRH
jgi:O-antigen/teichoic acid export membrane protein